MGLPWEMLPAEVGCGSGMPCWRRLRDRHEAGVWAALHRVPPERLHAAGRLDWRRAALDSASIPARGGEATGPNPAGRGKPGTKRHLVTDARGTPLGVALSGANRHDGTALAATLDAVPPVRSGKRGRPRGRPAKLHADKGHDHARCRRECRQRGVRPRIARRGAESSQEPGRHRRVVERTLARLARFRRSAARYGRRADIHLALTTLGRALVCLNQIRRVC